MKKKNRALARSKRKLVRSSRAMRNATRNKRKKLSRLAVKKKKNKPKNTNEKNKKKLVSRSPAAKAPKTASQPSNLTEYWRKLDTVSSKIDRVLAGLDSLTRKQTTNQVSLEERIGRIVAESNRQGKQQETQFPKSEVPPITPPSVKANANLSTELAKSEQELDRLKKEENAAKARLSNLNLEFEEIRSKVDALQKYYITQNQSLDGELEARRRAIHQRIEDERMKAESEIMLLLRQRDESRDQVRNLSEEKDTLRKDLEFAKSLSNLIKNPESVGEVELAALNERFDQARMSRVKGGRVSNSKARTALQRLLSTIGELSKN